MDGWARALSRTGYAFHNSTLSVAQSTATRRHPEVLVLSQPISARDGARSCPASSPPGWIVLGTQVLIVGIRYQYCLYLVLSGWRRKRQPAHDPDLLGLSLAWTWPVLYEREREERKREGQRPSSCRVRGRPRYRLVTVAATLPKVTGPILAPLSTCSYLTGQDLE